MEEERNALFDQVRDFSQGKLKKVEQVKDEDLSSTQPKLDLQVGLIVPGLLIGSQDVANDKSSVESYGITHILNLNPSAINKFEDELNYKNINLKDNTDITKLLDECCEFIDDGRHYGNVLVHCSTATGLSPSTTVCVAYLMEKEKKKLNEALEIVKEARAFVKPSENFMQQLKEIEVKLLGVQVAKSAGIDDPFALRKKQEIEAEKAALASSGGVKNRMKMFAAQLDANSATGASRSKSASPTPFKNNNNIVR